MQNYSDGTVSSTSATPPASSHSKSLTTVFMQILFAPSMTGELTQTRCDRPQFRIAVETASAAYALLEKKVEWMPLGGGKNTRKDSNSSSRRLAMRQRPRCCERADQVFASHFRRARNNPNEFMITKLMIAQKLHVGAIQIRSNIIQIDPVSEVTMQPLELNCSIMTLTMFYN